MSVTFVSIRENHLKEWVVLKKEVIFPTESSEFKIRKTPLLVSSISLIDEKTAKSAAAKFAELYQFNYIDPTVSVMTLTPLGENFCPIEVTFDERILGRGTVTRFKEAFLEAKQYAEKENIPFIFPEF